MTNNRYLIQGITEDLREGKTIGILTPFRRETRGVFDAVAEKLDGRETEHVSRAIGKESIRHTTGGRLYLLGSPAAVEEATLDVLVAIGWADYPNTARRTLSTFGAPLEIIHA